MAEELNPAQLRLKGITKDVSEVLVKNKTTIAEMEAVFGFLSKYQGSILAGEQVKPIDK